MTEILFYALMGKPLWMWAVFVSVILLLLAFDLGVLNRGDEELGIGKSLWLSAFYIGIAMAFGGGIWWAYETGRLVTEDGTHAGIAYFTGFFIEKALSIDNAFVISLIFAFFAIPARYQYRALVWGIIAVIVLRGLMIAAGAALIQNYGWVLYLFGAFLIATGIKMLVTMNKPLNIGANPLLRWLRQHLRVTENPHGNRFWVRLPAPDTRGGPPSDRPGAPLAWWATPLLLALVLIECADLIFAVDSVPAIFAITQDPFIVYTSNIFAILGLRALYFALAAIINRFAYLKYALAAILVFVGGKIIVADALDIGKVPAWLSLGTTAALLAAGILYSLHRTRTPVRQPHPC
jgi:tellurite resistance protein TerC